MANFEVNTPQEREALIAAIGSAIDYVNDTLTDDLCICGDKVGLNRTELLAIKQDIDDKVDRLIDLVRLQERASNVRV